MYKKSSNLQKASLFLSLVTMLVTILLVVPIELNTALFMFVPLTAALLTMLITGEAFSKEGWKTLGLHTFSWKFFMIGLLVPIIPIIAGYTFVWTTGLATFAMPDVYQGNVLLLIIEFILTLAIAALTVTLGEEIGWRGYLLPRLQDLGMKKALLLGSFIWGLFHVPIMIFTDLYHSDTNLLIYIPLFMVTILFAGAFMSYLRFVTGSIWPAVVAHASHNLIWAYADRFTAKQDGIVTYITGDAGVVLIVFYAVVFLVIVRKGAGNEKTFNLPM